MIKQGCLIPGPWYVLPDETAYSNFFYKVRKPQLTGAPFDLDQVHKEMIYRLDQSEQIGRRIAAESVAAIHAARRRPLRT